MNSKETIEMLVDQVRYILAKAQIDGNMVFDGHAPSTKEKHNAEECRRLSRKVESSLHTCKANEISTLLGSYEFLYMIGHHRMPDADFVDTHKRRVIDAWKQGDKTIEESDVFGLIAFEGAHPTPTTNREYISLYRTIKDRWLNTLAKFDRYPGVTANENYERLALIMRENLDDRFGSDTATKKRHWYEVNKVSDLSTLTTTLLATYRRFIASLPSGIITPSSHHALDTLILKTLSTRPDLTPPARASYSLSL